MAFSKLKTIQPIACERIRDGLWDTIGDVIGLFSTHECAAYFRHVGYVRN
jgi:hypothetical protein